MRNFAVFDIDGTLIRWQLYHAIVEQLIQLGYIAADEGIKIETARRNWRNRTHSFRDYEITLINIFHEARTLITHDEFMTAVDAAFELHKDQVYTYTRDLIKQFQTEGRLLFAISGSQQEIVDKLGAYYGFDAVIGSRHEWSADGHIGKVIFSPARQGKADTLRQLCERYDATMEGSYAVGDSGGDVTMLELVTHPIAFNPDKELFETARERGWRVVVERKNMVYELESTDGTYVLASPK